MAQRAMKIPVKTNACTVSLSFNILIVKMEFQFTSDLARDLPLKPHTSNASFGKTFRHFLVKILFLRALYKIPLDVFLFEI